MKASLVFNLPGDAEAFFWAARVDQLRNAVACFLARLETIIDHDGTPPEKRDVYENARELFYEYLDSGGLSAACVDWDEVYDDIPEAGP